MDKARKRVYPHLKEEVKKIIEDLLGEVVNEFPMTRFSNNFCGKVKLVKPLKVRQYEENLGVFCNQATGAALGLPIWLLIYLYGTQEQAEGLRFILPEDNATEIYIDIRLEQDEDFFWRADYSNFEEQATENNLLKEIQRAITRIKNEGIRY